ncbi:GntR family transcriptional regulator [Actinoplanes sp. NPDC023714]|uniref:GntR family transcriptional regulator n=1 Tax=Actinoplanes sp. NPDC023714 TaxID=3154322 RepID=UPI003402D86E
MADRLSFLSEPLPRDSGVPLRVQVHSRILDGIREGVLTPGSMIPTEAELGRMLGVSRTVVREALMLLDEDGFIVSRRGIGRFVADALPQAGLERIRPLEELLTVPGSRVELHRTEVTRQPTSSTFVTEGLGVALDTPTWFVETVLRRDGAAIALSQEHVTAGPDVDPLIAAARDEHAGLLALLLSRYGSAAGPGVIRFAAGPLGEARASALGADPAEPVLIVTQSVSRQGVPLYLAKHMLRAGAGHLSVLQQGQ